MGFHSSGTVDPEDHWNIQDSNSLHPTGEWPSSPSPCWKQYPRILLFKLEIILFHMSIPAVSPSPLPLPPLQVPQAPPNFHSDHQRGWGMPGWISSNCHRMCLLIFLCICRNIHLLWVFYMDKLLSKYPSACQVWNLPIMIPLFSQLPDTQYFILKEVCTFKYYNLFYFIIELLYMF